MDKHKKLVNDFKRLYEYRTYVVNDVAEPDFVKMTEDEEQSTNQQQPPATEKPVQPVTNQQQPTPVEKPEPTQQVPNQQQPTPVQSTINQQEQTFDSKFYYEKIMSDVNNLLISQNTLNMKFNEIVNKLEYLNKTVEEVKEPSNEEKLLSMTKQSYPFNNSMMEVWKDSMDKIKNDIGNNEIYKVDDEYRMKVNINDIPVSSNTRNILNISDNK